MSQARSILHRGTTLWDFIGQNHDKRLLSHVNIDTVLCATVICIINHVAKVLFFDYLIPPRESTLCLLFAALSLTHDINVLFLSTL